MLEEMLNRGPEILEADVHALEQALGVIFPADFVSFLLQFNGGVPGPGEFKFKDVDREGSIRNFYSIAPGTHRDFLDRARVRRGRLPKDFVAIAYESGGDEICMSLAPGPNHGKVFYWDHNFECDTDDDPEMTPETAGNTYLLADSFSEFLEGLYD